MTRIDEILQPFAWFGIKLGLESSQRLLERLGNPQRQVPILHVAGSNGKGSVCAYLSTVLTAAGYRVGRYTSPHLVDWNERICLNGQPIALTALEHLLKQVVAAIAPDAPSPTQFEIITAAAWVYFAQQKVDVAVIEVGLGGRLDATNVCDRPLACVITTISREHWQRLGPTLADIAREKAGILKLGCPAVVGPLPPEAMAVVRQRIAELGCPAVYPAPATPIEAGWAESQGIQYSLPLAGAIQLQNSALAIATLKWLQAQGWNLPDSIIARGIAQTQWPGRLQWFTWQGYPLLIDGAHNSEGAIALRQYVDQVLAKGQSNDLAGEVCFNLGQRAVTWIIGMMRHKDHQEVLAALLRPGDRLFLVPVPDNPAAEPDTLALLAQEICPDLHECQPFTDVFEALTVAVTPPSSSETGSTAVKPDLTVLSGSLYLIGYFLAKVRS